jgi:hypothetical protein
MGAWNGYSVAGDKLQAQGGPKDHMNHSCPITLAIVVALLFALNSCATVSDIDTSNKDPACAATCSTNYNDCVKAFTLYPIIAQHECAGSLHACATACPAKGAVGTPQTTEEKLKDLKRLHDAGLISDDVYSERQQAILSTR